MGKDHPPPPQTRNAYFARDLMLKSREEGYIYIEIVQNMDRIFLTEKNISNAESLAQNADTVKYSYLCSVQYPSSIARKLNFLYLIAINKEDFIFIVLCISVIIVFSVEV